MSVLRFLFREKYIAEFVLPNVMALACKCCDILVAAVFIWLSERVVSYVRWMFGREKKNSLRLQHSWLKGRR